MILASSSDKIADIVIQKEYRFSFKRTENPAVLLMIRGNADAETVNGKFEVKENELLFLQSEDFCFLKSKGPFLFVFFEISRRYMESAYFKSEGLEVSFYKNYVDRESQEYGNTFKSMMKIWKAYEDEIDVNSSKEIEKIYLFPDKRNNEIISENILNILKNKKMSTDLPKDTVNLINRVIDYMCEHNESFTLLELSEIFSISSNYLSKIFADFTKMKYVEFRNKLNLYKSLKILEISDANIITISHESGFSSNKVMNRTYLKYLKASPSKIRKEMDEEFEEYRRFREEKAESRIKFMPEIDFRSFMTEIDMTGKREKINYKNVNSLMSIKESINRNGWIESLNRGMLNEIRGEINYKDKKFFLKLVDYEIEFNEIIISEIEEAFSTLNYSPEIFIRFNFLKYKDYLRTEEKFQEVIKDHKKIIEEFLKHLKIMRGKSSTRNLAFEINLSLFSEEIENIDARRNIRMYLEQIFSHIEKEVNNPNLERGVYLGNIEKQEKTFEKLMNFVYDIDRVSFSICSSERIKEKGNIFNQIELISEDNCKRLEFLKNRDFGKIPEIYIDEIELSCNLDTIPKMYKRLFESSVLFKVFQSFYKIANNIESVSIINDTNGMKRYIQIITPKGFKSPVMNIIEILRTVRINECELVYSDENIILSQDNKDYIGIVMASKSWSLKYVENNNVSKVIERRKIVLKGISGRYKIVIYRVNLESGNSIYQHKKLNSLKLLTREEKEYLKLKSVPDMEGVILDLEGEWEKEFKMKPFEVVIFKLIEIH